MTLGGKMDDTVDMLILHEFVERIEVADIHFHELVVRLAFDVLQVREVARIRKFVEVDNLVFGILVHEKANHVATNEACAAGNDDILHRDSLQFKCEAQILKGRVLRVLFAQQRFKAVPHRPLDADFRIIPHQAAFILGVVKARALVHERRRLAENHKPVCKTFGNVELLLVLGRKRDALPLAERRTALAEASPTAPPQKKDSPWSAPKERDRVASTIVSEYN